MKERVTAILVHALMVVVVFVLVAATINALGLLGSESDAKEYQTSSGSAPYLSTIAISAGVLIAILTIARDRARLAREREENRSKILLEQSKEGIEEAYDLLKDQNNDRVIWVRAARVLLESVALGRQIKAPEYLDAFRLYQDKMRSKFFRALTVYNEETKERDPLPPQFFYGLEDWDRGISLDEAARETSQDIRVSDVSIDSIVAEPSLKPLAPKSVVAVFDFLEYPDDYQDRLQKVELWNDNWEDSHGPAQGAGRYVAHAQENIAVGGKLHKRGRAS